MRIILGLMLAGVCLAIEPTPASAVWICGLDHGAKGLVLYDFPEGRPLRQVDVAYTWQSANVRYRQVPPEQRVVGDNIEWMVVWDKNGHIGYVRGTDASIRCGGGF